MSHRIVKGDIVKVVSSLFVDDYFDACFCDPPYLLQFMGKEFDKQHKKMSGANEGQKMQTWHERWTREVLRVLKPGAHMLAFGGTRTYHRLASAAEDVGFEVRDMLAWMHGQGFPKGKTQLKPAHEPVVLARKPGSVGKLNIEGCRVGTTVETWPSSRKYSKGGAQPGSGKTAETQATGAVPPGRWPANLTLSHHSDCIDDGECHPDCPVRMLDEQSGITKSGIQTKPNPRSGGGLFKTVKGEAPEGLQYGDRGSASRFFYTAKVSPRERNLGGIDCRHPTLKPISLTTYLARLLLPPPSLKPKPVPRRLLIPFSGAGSEIIGALFAGWDEVWGVEQDEEYIADAEARISARHELTNRKVTK